MQKNSIQKLFQQEAEAHSDRAFSSRAVRRAFDAIKGCRSGAFGKHMVSCEKGCTREVRYHSCHHRFCPQCNALPRARWLEEQQTRLLQCDHRHIIFTLPSELRIYWCYHKEEVTNDLFYAAKEAIIRLCKQRLYMGALPGLLMAFHSWSRTMAKHPHLHCLVSTEGITEEGEWRSAERDCFLPWKLLMATFRTLLLKRWIRRARAGGWSAVLGDGATIARDLKREYARDWHVEVCPQYRHGRGVASYLARYMRGGPCHANQVEETETGQVKFSPKDGDRKAPVGFYTREQFIDRYLEHVPPHRLRVVRRYGVYASQGAAVRLREASRPRPVREKKALPTWFRLPEKCCAECGGVLTSPVWMWGASAPPKV
jgi:hypothetical protein